MPTVVQFRRGTTAQNNNFLGANGEISVDTTLNVLRVADAITLGGHALVGQNCVQTIANKTYTGTSLSVTGNVTGSYIFGNGSQLTGIDATSIQSGNSNVRVITSAGNVAVNVDGSGIITFTSAGIINNMGNGVGNIGNSTGLFNTVFAKATSAQYADLAEKYTADADYAPGTVLEFGGNQEVTATTTSHSPRVAGIVSTMPSYIMNDGLVSDHTAMVSLTGRVPCLVQGPIAKGDRLVASDVVGHAQRLDPAQYEPGCIIGKALEDYPSPAIGTIEVAVGRF
jgi:hypothetical protein